MTKKATFDNIEKILTAIAKSAKTHEGRRQVEYMLDEVGFYAEGEGYGEDAKAKVVVLGNWNTVTKYENGQFIDVDDAPKRAAKALDAMGVELEWSDQMARCGDCGGFVQTQPTSYGWQPNYIITEGDLRCRSCTDDDFLKEVIENDYLDQPNKALNLSWISDEDLERMGFVKLDGDFENGWHHGQDDDPKKIAAVLKEMGISPFFVISSVGQFDVAFEVWCAKEEQELFNEEEFNAANKRMDVSPAEQMKRALKNQPPDPPGEGIVVTTLHGDGTATKKRVSPEDFVAGKALDD